MGTLCARHHQMNSGLTTLESPLWCNKFHCRFNATSTTTFPSSLCLRREHPLCAFISLVLVWQAVDCPPFIYRLRFNTLMTQRSRNVLRFLVAQHLRPSEINYLKLQNAAVRASTVTSNGTLGALCNCLIRKELNGSSVAQYVDT